MGSIVKLEFWAETRSAESAETTTKERILKLLVVLIVELVTANTLADGSVSVLSEAGQGELVVVVRMDADRSASSRCSWTDDRSEGIS